MLGARQEIPRSEEIEMTYTYKGGKEIYMKDRHLVEMEAYKGKKFGRHNMTWSKKRKRGLDGGKKNKH